MKLDLLCCCLANFHLDDESVIALHMSRMCRDACYSSHYMPDTTRRPAITVSVSSTHHKRSRTTSRSGTRVICVTGFNEWDEPFERSDKNGAILMFCYSIMDMPHIHACVCVCVMGVMGVSIECFSVRQIRGKLNVLHSVTLLHPSYAGPKLYTFDKQLLLWKTCDHIRTNEAPRELSQIWHPATPPNNPSSWDGYGMARVGGLS